jgi:hypothetical protein
MTELRIVEGKVNAVADSVEILKGELIGLDSVVKTLKASVQNHDAALSKVSHPRRLPGLHAPSRCALSCLIVRPIGFRGVSNGPIILNAGGRSGSPD